MPIAKSIEISCESNNSFDEAIRQGITEAQKTVDNLKSVWVKDQQVNLTNTGDIDSYRVWLKATFEVK